MGSNFNYIFGSIDIIYFDGVDIQHEKNKLVGLKKQISGLEWYGPKLLLLGHYKREWKLVMY